MKPQKITLCAGVVGWPLAHSLSPALHQYWRDIYNVDGSYLRIPIRPGEGFELTIKQLVSAGFVGVNVTLPYKKQAAEMANASSEQVTRLGVANMLTFHEGKIFADNSDVAGFRASLSRVLTSEDKKEQALVLGAGGAAPAICLALEELGYQNIVIANRTKTKATALAALFSPIAKVIDWKDRSENLSDYDLLVNTTSLGMAGHKTLGLNLSGLSEKAIVADIVYTPVETELLVCARHAGLRVVDGLSMLMGQGVLGFGKWFNQEPEVTTSLARHLGDTLTQREKEPVRIGLTGSIGMGKTTIGQLLDRLGAPHWDADQAVHRLYEKGGAAAGLLEKVFPDAVKGGVVVRAKLAEHLMRRPQDFELLEQIVHPLVEADRQDFIYKKTKAGAEAVVLDIPLLLETGQQQAFDVVMVVTAEEAVRRKRVLARPGMGEEKYKTIVARQMPEEEKQLFADYLIRTDKSLEETAADVIAAYHDILQKYGSDKT